jgi:hypothetical protein
LFPQLLFLAVFFGKLAGNGLQLGDVAEIETQMIRSTQKFNRRTTVDFSTEPSILPNCC